MSPNPYPSDLTITLTQTAPTYTSQKTVLFSTTNRFRYNGIWYNNTGYGFNAINGATSSQINCATSYEIEFYMTGADVCIFAFNVAKSDYRVFVNDMPATMDWQQFPATGAPQYIKLNFATPPYPRYNKIRVMMGMNGLAGILLPGASDIWPAGPRPKMIVTGDSYVQGPGDSTPDGAVVAGNICGELAVRTGWEVLNMGQGGTGYSNNAGAAGGASAFGSSARMTALGLLPAVDLMMVYGGGNDSFFGSWPMATSIANANAMWTAMKAARPTTPLIVVGVQAGTNLTGFVSADMNTYNAALKAAALAHSGVTAFIDQRTSPWITGTGKQGTTVGDGNADLFICSDGVHPSHAGYGYLADRLVVELAAIRV